MNRDDHSKYTSHKDVWMLLPWHINGTLEVDESLFVEKHLKVCVSCRSEVAKLKRLATELSYSQTMELAASSSFSHLKERIRMSPELTPPIGVDNPLNGVMAWLTSRPRLIAAPLVVVAVVSISTYFLTKVIPYKLDRCFIKFFFKNPTDIVFSKN